MCPHCSGVVYVPLPLNVTAEQRQANDLGSDLRAPPPLLGSSPGGGTVYSITYPRT